MGRARSRMRTGSGTDSRMKNDATWQPRHTRSNACWKHTSLKAYSSRFGAIGSVSSLACTVLSGICDPDILMKGGRRGGARKGKGARQQALAAAFAFQHAGGTPSCLAQELMSLWCWGAMSPQTLQKLASAAQRDMHSVQQQTLECVRLQVQDYIPEDLRGS
eukprot:9469707-Pyramimonas_sp.AAC.1